MTGHYYHYPTESPLNIILVDALPEPFKGQLLSSYNGWERAALLVGNRAELLLRTAPVFLYALNLT